MPAACRAESVSPRNSQARKQVPTGSPRIPMVTVVAEIHLSSTLNTICPPIVETSARPRNAPQVEAG